MLKNFKNSLSFSFLGHLLLFLFLTISFSFHFLEPIYTPKEEEQAGSYVPSYVASEPSQPRSSVASSGVSKPSSAKAIEKPQPQKVSPATPVNAEAGKQAAFNQRPKYKTEETANKPLLKLLHDATGEHLVYPRIAADFNQSGLVQIGFLLSPDGYITEIKLLKSSGYDILDRAALDAIRTMSPVRGVGAYIDKPEYIATRIVFVDNRRERPPSAREDF